MRERLTWKRGGATNAPARRASAHPAYPDEGAASPAYQPDPEADAYENGDPSSWAEDPNPGPYPQSAHPAYPDEGPASPAYIAKQGSVALALERKAAKCVRLASAILGPTASQHEVESQAFAFMDMSERALQASLSRLAQQDDGAGDGSDEDAEEQQEQQAQKKAALRRRAQQAKKDEEEAQDAEKEEQQEVKGGKKAALAKAAYLRRLAQQIEEEVEEEVEESDEDESDEDEEEEKEAKKKASLNARLARIERLLTAGVPGMFMQHNMAQQKSPEEMMLEAMLGEEEQQAESMDDEAQSLEEMLLEEMQSEAQQAQPFGMMAEQLAMQGDASGPMMPKAESMQGLKSQQAFKAQQAEAQLAEMLQEEGMGEVLGAEYQDAPEAMLVDPSGDDYIGADGMLVDPSGDNYDDGMVADPMGLMGEGGNEDDAILASLFGDTESMKYAKKGQQDGDKADAEEQDADEPKKGQQKAAALRPQPRKASTGATRLGGITKEAAEVSDLSKLWESAPDVSKYF